MSLVSATCGNGPHLVLLHGWGLNSGVWQALLAPLAQHFCVTTIDLPGFGLNHQQLPPSYDLLSVATAVKQKIPQSATLLGWSLGGLIALKIAEMFPDHLSKLYLLASSPKFTEDEQWPGIKPDVLANFQQQLVLSLSQTISRFLAVQAMGSPSAKQDIKTIKQQIDSFPVADNTALEGSLKLLETTDLRSTLSQLVLPCHILLGRLDSLVPVKIIQSLRQLNPRFQYSIFEHSSHAPFISEPQRFLEVLIHSVTNN